MKILSIKDITGDNFWSENHKHLTLMRTNIQGADRITLQEATILLKKIVQIIPETEIGPHTNLENSYIEKTWIGQTVASVALALQRKLGFLPEFREVSKTMNPNVFNIIIEHPEPTIGEETLKISVEFFNGLINGEITDIENRLYQLTKRLRKFQFSPFLGKILKEAEKQDVPYLFFPGIPVVQFGYGKHSIKFFGSSPEHLPLIGSKVSSDYELMKSMLRFTGVPMPRQYEIREEARIPDAIDHLGFPVLCRFVMEEHSYPALVHDEQDVFRMHKLAREKGFQFFLEEFVSGNFYKIIFSEGRTPLVLQRVPSIISGNGRSTVEELLLKSDRHYPKHNFFPETTEEIRKQEISDFYRINHLSPGDILPDQQSYSFPGTAFFNIRYEQVPEPRLHPSIPALMNKVSERCGLKLCTINIVSKNLQKNIYDGNGWIISVDDVSSFNWEVEKFLESNDSFVKYFFAEYIDRKGKRRIPVISVAGAKNKHRISRLLSAALTNSGLRINEIPEGRTLQIVSDEDGTTVPFADIALTQPSLDAAIIPFSLKEFMVNGLRFSGAGNMIISDPGEDIFASDDVPREEISKIYSKLLNTLPENSNAILNGENEILRSLTDKARCRCCFYSVKSDPGDETCSFVSSGSIVIRDRKETISVLELKNIISLDDVTEGILEFVLPTVLTLHLSGVKTDMIRKSLESWFLPREENLVA